MVRWGCGLLAALALALLVGHAHGQDDREARAKAAFFEGHEAADAGDHETACDKFAESLALFRRGSTLLNLGRCHRRLGRSASALRFFSAAAALLEQGDDRLEEANTQRLELESIAPILRISMPADLPSTTVVRLDDAPITLSELANPLRLDAGTHAFTMTAAGHRPNAIEVALADGDDETVTLELGPAHPLPPPPAPMTAFERPEPPAALPPPSEAHHVPAWAWITGGAGLAVAAASIPFFVDYKAVVDEQLVLCRGVLTACDPEPPGSYDPADDNARRDRDLVLGTALAIVGGGALVAATVGAVLGEDLDDAASLGPTGLTISF